MKRLAIVGACFACLTAPVATALAASPAIVPLHRHAVSGRLSLTPALSGSRAVLSLRGSLYARQALRASLSRCLDTACRRHTARGQAAKAWARGRHRVATGLSVAAAPALRFELTAGRRVLSVRLLAIPRATGQPTSPVAEPLPGPAPAEAPAAAEGPAPPASFSFQATGLEPAYDPRIPNYTVSCDTPVAVDAAVPAGQQLSIDGGAPHSGETVHQDIALQPGQGFGFTIADGGGTHAHTARCRPPDLPTWETSRAGDPEVGWLVFNPGSSSDAPSPYVIIADAFGVPVWWIHTDTSMSPVDGKLLPDGTVAWARHTGGGFSHDAFEHYTLTGTNLGALSTVGTGTDQHDLQQLPNGDYLMIAYVPRTGVDLSSEGGPTSATVVDGEIQEVTADGKLVWSWNTKDHIGLDETAAWGLDNTKATDNGQPVYDLVHLNSIEDEGDGTVVFSARHLDAVYRIQRSDGAVLWKLGGTHRPESLTFVDDPLGATSFGGQHDARILPDGTLTVHDNGTRRNRPPRAVRYQVDGKAMTATLLEEVTDPRVTTSGCCGSARRLAGGDWVISWGGNPTITELTPAGSPVLTLTLATPFSYRAQALPPAALSYAQLNAAMDAQFPR